MSGSIILPTRPARDYQRKFWSYMEGGGDRAALCWHRRSGKDDQAAAWTAVSAVESKPAVYWHMLPEYAQARKAIWTALNPHTGMRRIDEWFPKAIRKRVREQEMEIELANGALWQVVGSDSFDRLVGASVRGLVLSEFALANPLAWTYIRPILRENKGWAIFPSTPRGRNHWHALFEAAESDPTWFAERLAATDTNVFSKEELALELAEMQREMGVDDGRLKFLQEYMCSWDAALVGAYYSREFEAVDDSKRICDVPFDPGLPVWTAWDLGWGDATAIWFLQLDGPAVRVIDYEEDNGRTLAHYAKLLSEKPYTYKTHLLPHDAGPGNLQTGLSHADQLRKLGLRDVLVLPREEVDPGIQLTRRLLARCWFDKAKTRIGVGMLRSYQKKWNDQAKVFMPQPLHNFASHGADAMRYAAMGLPERITARVETAGRARPKGNAARSRWAS